MSRNEENENVHNFLDQSFRPVRELPAEHVNSACDAVLQRLEGLPDNVVEDAEVELVRPNTRWLRPVFALSAAAVVTTVVLFLQMPQSSAGAVVENADGGLYGVEGGRTLRAGAGIEADEPVRTEGGMGAVLKLTDGSTVEMRSKSELSLEDATDGVRIRLKSGGVIVNAVKQRTGHLYVQTKHMTVAVAGTVFFVNAEEQGSRVAVIEGEVLVKQGSTEQKLLPGEQVATSPRMESPSVKDEITWSRRAKEHIALLAQALSQTASGIQPKPETSPAGKETFELAKIRLVPTSGGGTGGRGGGGGVGLPCRTVPRFFQVDPARFATTTNLYTLIIKAYTDIDCAYVAEFEEELLYGGPEWVRNDQVEIEALFPKGSLAGKEYVEGGTAKVKVMLRALLEDRFKLVVRHQQKELNAVILKLAESGSKLTPAREGDPGACGQFGGPVCSVISRSNGGPPNSPSFQGSNASMADIARMIGAKVFRPVLDRTHLTGEFTFKAAYVPREGDIGNDGRSFQRWKDAGVTGPNLFEALEKQLGLKAELRRAPVDVLVIDRVERPSEN